MKRWRDDITAQIDSVQAFRAAIGVAPWLGRASAVGDYVPLSGHPEEVFSVGTSTFTKSWRFATFAIDTDWPVDRIGITTTAASGGGTAAAIFGLFALDADNKPAAMEADWSGYGSLDLTAAPGNQILTTAGLIIPAGKWAVGVGWDGTGSNPTFYAIGNQSSSAGSSTMSALSNTGYQSNQSGASVPNPATPLTTTVLAPFIFVRNA